ncbi:MAG TPA: sigma-70 family RNA polymerase sigma factor [Solirubrobacterales bacterium]|jgi:RNA polymerase sigma factor (sigma-70 family)|nr:sigma-70 family RNA polymerase sigma factor [Solirubrobacterales bacterium]
MSEAAAAVGISRLLSDERLTRRAVGGDERAFAAIFSRYHQSLYRFCLAIVGNPEDAQDALQNTMIKVMRALPGEEREIELKPWLYRIAHNESIDLLRRRRETAQLDVEAVAPGHGLSEDVATRERLRGLLADLRELPDRQREVLVMREMSGLEFEEIGAALETSAAVVRQTLYEARQSLRQMEEGRELDCDAVSRALSDGDGRVARRRDVRAHLRSCASCREFRDEIKGRQQDLAALAPLPAAAAAAMLQGLVGGGSQAAGGGLAAALGGGAAKTIATSAAVKGVATVAVVAAVGVTAADRTGAIHLGLPGEESAKSGPAVPGAGSDSRHGAAPGGLEPSEDGGSGGGRRSEGSQQRHAGHHVPAPANAAPSGESHGQPAAHATPHGDPKTQGAMPDSAGGAQGTPPSAASHGQETAAEHKAPSSETGGGTKGGGTEKASPEESPSSSAPGSSGSPPEGPPENPPHGAAPEVPPQAQKPEVPPGQAERGPPVAPGGRDPSAAKRSP